MATAAAAVARVGSFGRRAQRRRRLLWSVGSGRLHLRFSLVDIWREHSKSTRGHRRRQPRAIDLQTASWARDIAAKRRRARSHARSNRFIGAKRRMSANERRRLRGRRQRATRPLLRARAHLKLSAVGKRECRRSQPIRARNWRARRRRSHQDAIFEYFEAAAICSSTCVSAALSRLHSCARFQATRARSQCKVARASRLRGALAPATSGTISVVAKRRWPKHDDELHANIGRGQKCATRAFGTNN